MFYNLLGNQHFLWITGSRLPIFAILGGGGGEAAPKTIEIDQVEILNKIIGFHLNLGDLSHY